MKPAALLTLLNDFYNVKVALRLRHEAGAKSISDYEINNTYQYVIAREDVHVSWLRSAIQELDPDSSLPPPPSGDLALDRSRDDAARIIDDDAARAREVVDQWRDRIQAVTNARERTMLQVILGEMLEHKRFFDLAAAGRRELLGRRDTPRAPGKVLPTRWVE